MINNQHQKKRLLFRGIALALGGAILLGACSSPAETAETPAVVELETTETETEATEIVEAEPEIIEPEAAEPELAVTADEPTDMSLEEQLIGYWGFVEGSDTLGLDSDALFVFDENDFGWMGRGIVPIWWQLDGDTLTFGKLPDDNTAVQMTVSLDGDSLKLSDSVDPIVVELQRTNGIPAADLAAETELRNYLEAHSWVLPDQDGFFPYIGFSDDEMMIVGELFDIEWPGVPLGWKLVNNIVWIYSPRGDLFLDMWAVTDFGDGSLTLTFVGDGAVESFVAAPGRISWGSSAG